MDVTTHRLLRTFLHRSHVTSRLRCSLRPTEPIRAAIATSTGDGRLLARCQLAAGVLPGESAMGHFAHEAGKGIQTGGASDGYSLKRVERVFAGRLARDASRAGFMEQTKRTLFRKSSY